jgi:hypothetical protein
MYGQQVSKPEAAYYLTLIGGILGICVGVVLLFFLVGVWIIIANALMIMYAQRLMAQPNEHSKYGTYIIVLSILAGVNILALIGGILATTHQPYPQPYQPYTQQPPYQPALAGYCRLCGAPLTTDAQFCPNCGKQVQPPP